MIKPLLPQLLRSNFSYLLPNERIAKFPINPRDHSKLLIYRDKEIRHQHFFNLPSALPEKALLVFNNTRVISARLFFATETGAKIEVFLLSPVYPTSEIQLAMQVVGKVTWECAIGNRKKWKPGQILQLVLPDGSTLKAAWADYDKNLVELSWDVNLGTLTEILEMAGKIPLPPYLKREAIPEDILNYQTVYARNSGAVAAPTAGLHFTQALLRQLEEMGFLFAETTLHVGAGTFKPLSADNVSDHDMHNEELIISKTLIEKLVSHPEKIIAVGTTTVRTLESLYWFGCQMMFEKTEKFNILKDTAFRMMAQYPNLPNSKKVFSFLLDWMEANRLESITGHTEIYIMPGYNFKVIKGLITNFHQPESTLILLIAALIGENWRKVYQEALNNDYRFLSFGDSSLLIP